MSKYSNIFSLASGINLNQYINSILGNSQDPNNFTVRFYTSLSDADADTNSINGDDFTNTIANSQTIFARVSNNQTGCSATGSAFNINILPVPMLAAPSDLELCDDDTDGFVNGFDLDSQTSTILNGLDPTLYTITYHSSLSDAQQGINSLSSPYTNTIADQQTIFGRGINNATGCVNTSITFNLIVNPLPVANFASNLEVCDDDTDGSPVNGFSQSIDLEQQTAIILGNQDPNSFRVTYHTSSSDAASGTSPITGLFTNTVAFTQTIYTRVENITTNCVNSFSNFDVIINPEPTAQIINDIEICDDDTDGIISGIDLNQYITNILGSSQSPNDFTVTFHLNQTGADTGSNPINANSFTNTIPNSQAIFVRVVNNTTGCFNSTTSFNINILSLPVLTSPTNLELCDDDTDGLVSGFDLESQTLSILNGLDPNLYTITYHSSLSDAQNGINTLTSSYTNTTANQQTIYVRGVNNTTGCANTSISFNLIVNPLPVVASLNDFIVCDDGSGGVEDAGSTTDGIVHNINLQVFSSSILGNLDPRNYRVSYFFSLSDAQNNSNPITTPFTNTVALNQTIYVKITNTITLCESNIETFSIIVNPAPTINPVEDVSLCDNDLDGDDTNGFLQNINLVSFISDILGSVRGDLLPQADLDYALVVRETNVNGDIEIHQFDLAKAITKNTENNLQLSPNDKIIVFSRFEEKTLEELLLQEEVLTQNEIVLFNDDVNTFDHVIECLVKICEHSYLQAEQCAYIVHYSGKCSVKTGALEELIPKCTALLEEGLSAEVV